MGILNDDSNSVGSVHLGVVYLVDLEAPAARVREGELLEGRFVPVSSLAEYLEAMETWSRVLAAALWIG